jgi:hypothetical protein
MLTSGSTTGWSVLHEDNAIEARARKKNDFFIFNNICKLLKFFNPAKV